MSGMKIMVLRNPFGLPSRFWIKEKHSNRAFTHKVDEWANEYPKDKTLVFY